MAQHSRRPLDHYPASSQEASSRGVFRVGLWSTCLIITGTILGGCNVTDNLFGKTGPVTSPNGGVVVADEPQAALVGRNVLARGGNAADAATATAFALSVTLPSRASLGGGGACLVSQPNTQPQAITFLPVTGSGAGDRPATVPMMARGLYMLQLRYGTVQFEDTLAPSIDLARYGITVSQTLANDLAAVHTPLIADNTAFSVFWKDNGNVLTNGDLLIQTRLTSFLSRLKLVGVGDLYNGALSSVFIDQANKAGAGLTHEDLRQALPKESPALTLTDPHFQAAFLPPPADGGLGAAMAYAHSVSAEQAVSTWRHAQMSGLPAAQAFLKERKVTAKGLPNLPASTSFVVSDRNGMAVACSLSENNLFGTGRIAGTTGVVLGASPKNYPQPLLTAAIVRTPTTGQLEAVLASSGQNDAAQEVANALQDIAAHHQARDHQTPNGRLNIIQCTVEDCHGSSDPRNSDPGTQTTK